MLDDHLIDTKNSEQCSLFLIVALCTPLRVLRVVQQRVKPVWCKPILSLIVLLLLAGCQLGTPAAVQAVFSGPIMGTHYRITIIVEPNTDTQVLEQNIIASMQAVNQSMSTYIEDSELSRFNRASADLRFDVSEGLAEVLEQAQSVSRLTDGAFDVTLAPAINLWGFGSDGRVTHVPDAQTLDSLRASIGYQKIELLDQAVRKKHSATSVDLSAIAKGYAVDQVAATLERLGIHDYLIDIGGELKAAGANIDKQIWRVGIEKPQVLGGVQKVVLLSELAIATSGDYRNFYVLDGKPYSHTIDPRTLAPVLHKLALVSVLHKSASMADALATAMMAMGEDDAVSFAELNNLGAYFIIRGDEPGEFSEIMTDQFRLNLP